MSTTTTKPKQTKKFKALLALIGDEERAVQVWNKQNPNNPIGKVAVDPRLKELLDAGFSEDEAKQALAAAAETTSTAKSEEPAPLTSKEHADVLVAKEGLIHVRGRVYSNSTLIEAQVRVLKTGKPEVVRQAGEHRTKAVVVFRTDDGKSIAMQNLGEQN